MMMRGIRLDLSGCAKIECALSFIIIISTILHQKAFISLCFALSFVVLMAYTLYQTAVVGTDASVLALVYLAVMNVLINALISGKLGISFDYLKKVIRKEEKKEKINSISITIVSVFFTIMTLYGTYTFFAKVIEYIIGIL